MCSNELNFVFLLNHSWYVQRKNIVSKETYRPIVVNCLCLHINFVCIIFSPVYFAIYLFRSLLFVRCFVFVWPRHLINCLLMCVCVSALAFCPESARNNCVCIFVFNLPIRFACGLSLFCFQAFRRAFEVDWIISPQNSSLAPKRKAIECVSVRLYLWLRYLFIELWLWLTRKPFFISSFLSNMSFYLSHDDWTEKKMKLDQKLISNSMPSAIRWQLNFHAIEMMAHNCCLSELSGFFNKI